MSSIISMRGQRGTVDLEEVLNHTSDGALLMRGRVTGACATNPEIAGGGRG